MPTRRGAVLLILALIEFILGWATFVAPGAVLSHLVLVSSMDPRALGAAQIGLAPAIAMAAYMSPPKDKVGFTLASLGYGFWAGIYLLTAIFQPEGDPMSFVRGFAIYGGFSALVLIISGMVGARQANKP